MNSYPLWVRSFSRGRKNLRNSASLHTHPMDTVWQPPNFQTSYHALGQISKHDDLFKDPLFKQSQILHSFELKTPPTYHDWLGSTGAKDRTGQTYDQFVKDSTHVPTPTNNKIYLVPLGEFEEKISQELLIEFLNIWFDSNLKVCLLETVPTKTVLGFEKRVRKDEGKTAFSFFFFHIFC